MFEDKGAQDHHPCALLARLPFGVEVAHAGDLPRVVRIDAVDLCSSPEIEVAGFQSHRNRHVKRCRLGMNMTAIKIAMAAVDARRSFWYSRVEGLRRPIRLGENARSGIIGMVSELPARF